MSVNAGEFLRKRLKFQLKQKMNDNDLYPAKKKSK